MPQLKEGPTGAPQTVHCLYRIANKGLLGWLDAQGAVLAKRTITTAKQTPGLKLVFTYSACLAEAIYWAGESYGFEAQIHKQIHKLEIISWVGVTSKRINRYPRL